MAQFRDTDFGFSDMSRAELDAAADRGGRIGSAGYGYAIPIESPPHDGYRLRIVARMGMGNHGIAVIQGTTPETVTRCRVGSAATLAEEKGIGFDVADTILGTRASYVHEDAVIDAALAEWDSPAWEHTASIDRYRSTRAWLAEFGVAEHGLSEPRLRAMIAICVRLYGSFR